VTSGRDRILIAVPMARSPLTACAAALLLPALAAAASFPPDLRFRTISIGRVSVHYHQEVETIARRAAALAEEILAAHERRYGVHVGHLDLVVADVDDSPNGNATPLPRPRVQISAMGPPGNDDLGNYDDWLRYVLTHELAHIVHLEEGRGAVRAGRKLLGRAPFLFPNLATPTWMIEGLATVEETRGTAFGRGDETDTRMVLRMAALEGRFLREDQATTALDRWPGGLGAYLFGEAFLDDLTRRAGDRVLPELARVNSGHLLPYFDDLTARKVTHSSFHDLWKHWALVTGERSAMEKTAIEARGLTPSRAVTDRGVGQLAPRLSPDGAWIAYTSRVLTRYRSLRLVRPDGTGDHRLVSRNGGTGLAWTPDGGRLVFDELEVHRLFRTRYDLRVVEVATRRVRRLTSGQRARQPDVSPDGRAVVFVQDRADRSELAVLDLQTRVTRPLTRSELGTRWSGPRWDPSGGRIAASRWSRGGYLDIVLVDARSGAVRPLTSDRAKDVEPAWTPDGTHVVFRSDRDGVSNLYALRLADGALLRVTNVLGGAFTPDVAPDGREVAFADYRARGYDVHLTDLDLAQLPPAPAYEDDRGPSAPEAAPVTVRDRPYRPWPAALPRLWSPYADFSDEFSLGAATGGVDPLFRHAWAADLRYGFDTRRPSVQGFYQYDRYLPTLFATFEDKTDPLSSGGRQRKREASLRASVPVRRTLRSSHSLALAWRRRHEQAGATLNLGGLEASWSFSSVKQYPFSISPTDGVRLRLAAEKEMPGLGSDVSLLKATADLRAYLRVLGNGDALALRAGAGETWGEPAFRRSFAVGGFPDGSLFDVVRTNHSVLRGYPDDAFTGRRFAHVNVEYRFPIARPQRGYRTTPLFVRHVHGAVFADAADAWTGAFRMGDVKTAAGAGLGSDVVLGHAVPLTFTAGLARGFAQKGETRAYFRLGLAF
jgi:Tol biopolymer transport system component